MPCLTWLHGLTQLHINSSRICCMTLSLVSPLPTDCGPFLFFPDPATFTTPEPIPQTSSLTISSLSTSPPVFNPSVLSIHLSVLCLCRLCMCLYVQMYPALPISHIEESKRPVTIHAWCKKGWGHCQTHPFIVLPYRCLGKNNTPHRHWSITRIHTMRFPVCPYEERSFLPCDREKKQAR